MIRSIINPRVLAIYVLCFFTHVAISGSIHESPNLLKGLSKSDLGSLKWMNEPKKVEYSDNGFTVFSDPKTDFFIDPSNGKATASAPLLYKEVEGDFVAVALVKPHLSGTWNAGSLMAVLDDSHWIKFAFENSDATGNSIVTVVTREVSDDANGVRLHKAKKIWLKLIRKGELFSMLWS